MADGGTATGAELAMATERLYRALFTAAVVLALGVTLWGVAIVPFNTYDHHDTRSLALGVGLGILAVGALVKRSELYGLLRRRPALLLIVAVLGSAVLWADGGWRSSFYLASYSAIPLAVVAGTPRLVVSCAVLAAAGYLSGLAVNNYGWSELERLHDVDSVVANAGGYVIAALLLGYPAAWLGRFVAHLGQLIVEASTEKPRRLWTKRLSARETQVVQLLADGLSNQEIANALGIGVRTVDEHISNARAKTQTRNRTALAVLALREGLVPMMVPPDVARPAGARRASPPEGAPSDRPP